MIEVYGHGGDVETASLRYGINPRDFIDFSSNINPLGPPPGLMAGLTDALASITRYPDPGHRGLKSMLARKLNLDEDRLSIGNGAAETMALALLAVSPKTVGIVEPCFSEYAALATQFGAQVISVRGKAEQNFHADLEDLEQLIIESDLVFLGQPNNPNGVQYGIDVLRYCAEWAQRERTYLVVDEAFMDFIVPQERASLLPELQAYPHLILIRSMTKFYAIPGLRLGYGIADPKLIQAMTDKQVTWSVNQLALTAGQICLAGGTEYELATIALIREEREFLRNGLGCLGCRTWAGEANYLLVRLPVGWTAAQMQDKLGQQGILVRSCAMYPGLEAVDIRLAVKGRADNERLLQQMEGILKANDEV